MSPNARLTKIRTLIVDDEPLARSNLSVLLCRDPEVEIIGECGSGGDALLAIRDAVPDLLFLDVQMPECDGFDVLERLAGKALPSAIIFVTAYDQYALRAFEAGALDYLLKPFDDSRFDRAMNRAKQQILREKALPRKLDRLAIKSVGQVCFVRIAEIDWIEASDYYACLHVGPKTHLLRRSMAELEEELDPEIFCRIHRSTIVNLKRVRSLELGTEGEYEVLIEGGTALRLSRRYRKDLRIRLGIHESNHT
jgi:two-component system LytT family response regulator